MNSKLKEKFIVFILISIPIIFIVSILLKGTVLSKFTSTDEKNIIKVSYSPTSLLGPANVTIKSK